MDSDQEVTSWVLIDNTSQARSQDFAKRGAQVIFNVIVMQVPYFDLFCVISHVRLASIGNSNFKGVYTRE